MKTGPEDVRGQAPMQKKTLCEEKPRRWKLFLEADADAMRHAARTLPLPPLGWHFAAPGNSKNIWKWSQMTPGSIPDRPKQCQRNVNFYFKHHVKNYLWLTLELPKLPRNLPPIQIWTPSPHEKSDKPSVCFLGLPLAVFFHQKCFVWN